MIPIFIPSPVSLISAFYDLKIILYSDLEVNILYGSVTPNEVKSSINTPIYAFVLYKTYSFLFIALNPAFNPAIIP
jgi:hypothetical protein